MPDVSNQAAVLRWALDQLAAEIRDGEPGQALMADHLAQIMLLQVLPVVAEQAGQVVRLARCAVQSPPCAGDRRHAS